MKILLLNSPLCLSRFETVKVDEVRSESVDDGAEAESISPGLGHVDNVDTRVVLGHSVTPHLQSSNPRQQHPEEEERRSVTGYETVSDSTEDTLRDHALDIACLRNYILP